MAPIRARRTPASSVVPGTHDSARAPSGAARRPAPVDGRSFLRDRDGKLSSKYLDSWGEVKVFRATRYLHLGARLHPPAEWRRRHADDPPRVRDWTSDSRPMRSARWCAARNNWGRSSPVLSFVVGSSPLARYECGGSGAPLLTRYLGRSALENLRRSGIDLARVARRPKKG